MSSGTLKSIISEQSYLSSSPSIKIATPPMSAISGWSNFKSDIFNMKAPSHIEQYSAYMDIDFSLDMADIENMDFEFKELLSNDDTANECKTNQSGSDEYQQSRRDTDDMNYQRLRTDTIKEFELHCMSDDYNEDGSAIVRYDESNVIDDDEGSVTEYHVYQNEEYLERLAEEIVNDEPALNSIRDTLEINDECRESNSSSNESFIGFNVGGGGGGNEEEKEEKEKEEKNVRNKSGKRNSTEKRTHFEDGIFSKKLKKKKKRGKGGGKDVNVVIDGNESGKKKKNKKLKKISGKKTDLVVKNTKMGVENNLEKKSKKKIKLKIKKKKKKTGKK